MKKAYRLLAYATLLLVLLQVAVVMGSWLLSAASPNLPIRSLLSSEGLRWLFGQLAYNLCTPPLLWIILGVFAVSVCRASGLVDALRDVKRLSSPQRYALGAAALVLLAGVVCMFLLTFTPQAILLNATGGLFPSSFSECVVPILLIQLCLVAVTYGVTCGRLTSVVGVFRCFTAHTGATPPLILFYFSAAELYAMLRFVLMF